jgi:hypothetical protein
MAAPVNVNAAAATKPSRATSAIAKAVIAADGVLAPNGTTSRKGKLTASAPGMSPIARRGAAIAAGRLDWKTLEEEAA